jgi:amidase
VPVAHGSDGGGSIRIPAACCGLVGLKPSRGRISPGPESGDSFLATQGVLTRTARDSALLLDILAGYEPGDATWAAPPPEPFAATAAHPPRPLRIAFTTTSPLQATVDPACAWAVQEAAALLASLGHEVTEAAPSGWQNDQLLDTFLALWFTGPLGTVRFGIERLGREPRPDELEALSWRFYERGKALSAADYLAAIGWLQGYTRSIAPFFGTHDLLLTPSLAQRPLPVGYLDTCGPDLDAEFAKAIAFTPFTLPWNVTGQPAISVPLFHGNDGLPLGVQFVGPPLGDGLLLALANQLELARPWAERRPDVVKT